MPKEDIHSIGKLREQNLFLLKDGVAKWTFPRGTNTKIFLRNSSANSVQAGAQLRKQNKVDLEKNVSSELRMKIDSLFAANNKGPDIDDKEISYSKEESGGSGAIFEKYMEMRSPAEDDYIYYSVSNSSDEECWPYTSLTKSLNKNIPIGHKSITDFEEEDNSVAEKSLGESSFSSDQNPSYDKDLHTYTEEDASILGDMRKIEKYEMETINNCENCYEDCCEDITVEGPSDPMTLQKDNSELTKNLKKITKKLRHKTNSKREVQRNKNYNAKDNKVAGSSDDLKDSVILKLFRLYAKSVFKEMQPEFKLYDEFDDNAKI